MPGRWPSLPQGKKKPRGMGVTMTVSGIPVSIQGQWEHLEDIEGIDGNEGRVVDRGEFRLIIRNG